MPRTIERRAVHAALEVRETPTTFSLHGYAARFDSPSHGEVVRSSAFTKTLAESADVRLLINHDGVPLARTKSGTLGLGVDGDGLWADAPELDRSNPRVQELVSALRREDVDQMSFAFVDHTPQEHRMDEDGVRNVREAQLFDVSVVTFPWYEDTHAELNELDATFASIRNGAPLSKEQRDNLAALIIADEDETEELLLDVIADDGGTARHWRVEAARALLRRAA